MDDRQASDALARNRWLAINAVRFCGVALVLLGILIVRGVIDLPAAVGYAFLPVGLIDVFLIPRLLARKWRTPPE
jgi:hypothetical protein